MNALRTIVVGVLLGVWFTPAVGSAAQLSSGAGEAASQGAAARSAGAATPLAPSSSEARAFAAREKQSPELENFKGGGVSIYIGSGALLVIVIVLLIIAL